MPLPPQQVNLEEDMLAQAAPQQAEAVPQSMSPIADTMQQGVQDPMGDFITTFVRMAEAKGMDMDEMMGPDTIADQTDQASDPDPLELLSREEMKILSDKFILLPPEQQQEIVTAVANDVNPRTASMWNAAVRLSQQEQGTV